MREPPTSLARKDDAHVPQRRISVDPLVALAIIFPERGGFRCRPQERFGREWTQTRNHGFAPVRRGHALRDGLDQHSRARENWQSRSKQRVLGLADNAQQLTVHEINGGAGSTLWRWPWPGARLLAAGLRAAVDRGFYRCRTIIDDQATGHRCLE
jgi:hypothetical protein